MGIFELNVLINKVLTHTIACSSFVCPLMNPKSPILPNIIIHFQMLKSDDDIACILGHEIAHRVLRHDVDKASRGHLLEILFICLGSLIWLILPDDLTSFVTQMISEKVLQIVLKRPYSRMMEEEADTFGLDLAAKSCYDIRYSSNLWSMMYLNSKLSAEGGADIPFQKFLSTHPLDKERAGTYRICKLPEK